MLDTHRQAAPTYSTRQRTRIALAAYSCERTVRRYLGDPDAVTELTRLRIERAMRELALEPSVNAA